MFMKMMFACSWIPWVLLFLELLPPGQASVIVGCPTFRYMLNGTCYPCPDNCRECASVTNCSLCTRGFFGPVCENRCGETCTGTCHKLFGHCTYGCPDWMYPAEGNGCKQCPLQCSLCESQRKCVKCDDGYFGKICQQKCPDNCTTCNIITGQCLQCNDSYFKLNGQCKSCQQGCRVCVSAYTCSQCKDSYFLLDGVCTKCPSGCRTCISAEKCRSCEDGFQGPLYNRCLYKCPGNGVTTYNVPYEDGRCRIWQDTTTNTCHLHSEIHSCTSSGSCLQDIRCPDSGLCVDETYKQTSCVRAMYYDCKHTCKPLVSHYGCEVNCTVEARDNGDNRLLCMTDIGYTEANMFHNTTEAYCKPQQVTPTGDTSWPTVRIVLVVCVIVCGITICILIALMTCRRGFTKQTTSKEEDSTLNELTTPHNGTKAHVLSAFRHDDDQTTVPMMPVKHLSNSSVDEGFDGSSEMSKEHVFSTTVCF